MLPRIETKGKFRNRITFPKTLSNELAEEIGIHIGDGSLFLRKKEGHYDYFVCFHRDEESYKNYVIQLIESIYGIKPSHVDKDEKEKSILVEYNSKQLFLWKRAIGMPDGDKRKILIPKFLINSKFVVACIRGIFDTDGSVTFKKKYRDCHYYPVIKIDNKNPMLISQLESALEKMGINTSSQMNKPMKASNGSVSLLSTVYISGKRNINKWFDVVSPKNENHITKYRIWKEFGFCPPKSTLEQRKMILDGTLNPNEFYAGGEIRTRDFCDSPSVFHSMHLHRQRS